MQQNYPISSIKSILQKRGWIDIPSSGVSMYPLIKQGDICRFIPLESTRKLKKGDILLFVHEKGSLVGHRYYRQYVKDGETFFIFKGDTNALPDTPVKSSQIVGKLSLIKKGKLQFKPQGLLIKLWGIIVFTLPFLPRLCREYLSRKSNIRDG